MKKSHNNKGFTLVELIVVMVITSLFLLMTTSIIYSTLSSYNKSMNLDYQNYLLKTIEIYTSKIVDEVNSDSNLKLEVDSDNNKLNVYNSDTLYSDEIYGLKITTSSSNTYLVYTNKIEPNDLTYKIETTGYSVLFSNTDNILTLEIKKDDNSLYTKKYLIYGGFYGS